MRLQHMVELVRGQNEEKKMTFTAAGTDGYCERKEKTAEGRIQGDGWQKEIAVDVHQPESFMRMLTIFQNDGGGEQRHGHVEQAGD